MDYTEIVNRIFKEIRDINKIKSNIAHIEKFQKPGDPLHPETFMKISSMALSASFLNLSSLIDLWKSDGAKVFADEDVEAGDG